MPPKTRSQSKAESKQKYYYKSKNSAVIKEFFLTEKEAKKTIRDKKQTFFKVKNPLESNKNYKQTSKGIFKEKVQNITLNIKKTGPMKLKYKGKYLYKYSFDIKNPVKSNKVIKFIEKFFKTINTNDIDLYYISSNFEGIGWRSTNKINIDDAIKVFDPMDFEIYDNNNINFNQEITEFEIIIISK